VADPGLLQRVTPKQIMMRMIQNMHRAYVRSRDWSRAIATLDLMIAGAPETPSWYKHRGALLMTVQRWLAARRDFEKYLELQPDAPDRDEVVDRIRDLQKRVALAN
jgi:regulator of sirC expression with transglutaminase-like and TPR domain